MSSVVMDSTCKIELCDFEIAGLGDFEVAGMARDDEDRNVGAFEE